MNFAGLALDRCQNGVEKNGQGQMIFGLSEWAVKLNGGLVSRMRLDGCRDEQKIPVSLFCFSQNTTNQWD